MAVSRKGSGPRPRAGAPASLIIPVRATPEERERFQAAAEKLGVTLADEARAQWERMVKRAERKEG